MKDVTAADNVIIKNGKNTIFARRKVLLRRVKTGCLYLISAALSKLNNTKNRRLAGTNRPLDRALLISVHHIGDFIWSTSVIRELSKTYPGMEFDVVVRPENREIAPLLPNVRKVLTLNHARGRGYGLPTGRLDWSNLNNVLTEIRKSEYDAFILATPDTLLNLLLQILSLPKRRPTVVSDSSWLRLHNIFTGTAMKTHDLDILQQLIAPLVKDDKVPELIPFIEPPQTNRPQHNSYSQDTLTIGFCIGAGWEHRKWDRNYYLKLANLILQDYTDAIIMVYGYDSDDAEVADFIRHNCDCPERVETFINKGMTEFLTSLQGCDLALSNDSGPAHICSALAIPLLVVFGPETPARKAPRGRSPVKVYWKNIECSPCDQSVCFNPVKQKCMDSVLPAEVFEGVKEIIQGLQTNPRTEEFAGMSTLKDALSPDPVEA